MKRVVLDIDGVIVKGGALIAGAAEAIMKLQRHRIPYCFVTNGGGVLESVKAAEMTKKLGFHVDPKQMIVCHTPMQQLAAEFGNKKVLVLGKSSCLEVARSYGFSNAVSIEQLHAEHPHIYPCRTAATTTTGAAASATNTGATAATNITDASITNSTTGTIFDTTTGSTTVGTGTSIVGSGYRNDLHSLQAVSAAIIFHDPHDWGVEMQILSDVLAPININNNSNNSDNNINSISSDVSIPQQGRQQQQQRVPLFSSNNDLVYCTEFPTPRFTQGAFLTAFSHLFTAAHSIPLRVEFFGKPFAVQYEYAAKVLQQEALRLSVATTADHTGTSTNNAVAVGGNAINAATTATATASNNNYDDEGVIYFGIGDNPKSDIRGANAAGAQWRSILVRTGVFSNTYLLNDPDDPADFVCDDLAAAVDVILRYSPACDSNNNSRNSSSNNL